MWKWKRRNKFFIFFLIYTLFLVIVCNAITTNLLEPQDDIIFGTTNNITFSCNVSSDNYLKLSALYHNISGKFSLNRTYYLAGINPDESTVLLFHFNNDSLVKENSSFVYDWSGKGNNGNVNAIYNPYGKILGSYEFNDTEYTYIEVADSDSLDLTTEGTMELWVKIYSFNYWNCILTKGNDMDDNLNPYTLWVENYYGKGRIWVYMGDGSTNDGLGPAGPLSFYKWYHVAATWNTTHIQIYINGKLNYTGSKTIIPFNSDGILRIGGNVPQQYYFNGSVDELALYNKMLNGTEIEEHYNLTLKTNAVINWTIANIPDGTYRWNCLAYDNISQFSWGVNRTFSVDVQTPPSIENVSISPSSADDVDPGVTINVTARVTDISGVDTVILQYKRSGISTWSNISMSNITSSLWKASFTPESPPDIWDYRIWANDSWGHWGVSEKYNLTVDYDYTWNVTPWNLGETYIPVTETMEFGVITINNTGDYPLNFKLSSNWLDTFYNLSNYDNFDVFAKETQAIQINVTAPEVPGEYKIQIKVNATTSGATPSLILVNGTLIAYIGGPYFKVDIEDYPLTILQSQKSNLTVRIKNIGNETATDVWVNWILPTGWNAISGNLIQYLGNLSSGEIVYHQIEVYLDANKAKRGSVKLGVNVSCSEGVYKEDWKLVGVECNSKDGICGAGCYYEVDDDCPKPKEEVLLPMVGKIEILNLSVTVPPRIDVFRGKEEEFKVKIFNPMNRKVGNITLFFSGYPLIHIRITPLMIGKLNKGESATFNIRIFAPGYMKYGEYNVSLKVRGTVWITNLTTIEKTLPLKIVIHSIKENETLKILEEANNSIFTLKRLNLSTKKVEGFWESALIALKDWNWDSAWELGNKIVETSRRAIKLYEQLQELEKRIEEARKYGIKTPETSKMMYLAFSAFRREDYDRAEERISNAILAYAIEARELQLRKFIWEKWWLILISSSIPLVLGLLSYRNLMISTIERRLKILGKEERKIKGMIKKLQEDYFIRDKISKTDFESSMKEYERRLVEITAKKARLLSIKIGILKVRKRRSYEEERRRLQKLVRQAQIEYFKKGKISREEYMRRMEELKARLAEIEKRLKVIE